MNLFEEVSPTNATAVCGRVFRGVRNENPSRGATCENQSRGATCQNPTEVLQIKIHIFFSPLNPLQMTAAVSGRGFLNSPLIKAPRNSYLFDPKARQNHFRPSIFHFLNSPLNPAEIENGVEPLEIKI